MASIQPRAGKWQLRVQHKLLPKPFFSTFENEDEARAYGVQLESLLDRGIVPVELMDATQRGSDPLLLKVLTDYQRAAPYAPSDAPLLAALMVEHGAVRLSSVTASWADNWVAKMAHLAPGTIRKRVECLARVIDWYWRSREVSPPANPLRMMPKGYSTHTSIKRDKQRDRRLSALEIEECRAALAGVKRPDRERAVLVDPAFSLLFELILATGMRLSEAYSLRVDQIDLSSWVIRVEGSKGHRGAIKPRVVPLVKEIRLPLADWCMGRVGRLFAFWDGTDTDKIKATRRLSNRFATLFAYAGVPDCTEHDMRHTATCMWFELRRPDGAWVLSEVAVCKIMGWSDTRMALRYASLRGEDLAAMLG